MNTPRVLYLCWNSLDEPLVHSQVLNYLEGLARKGWHFTLVTPETGRSRQWLAEKKQWIGQRFGEAVQWQPAIVPKVLDRTGTLGKLWQMGRQIRKVINTQPVQLIHARSYLPAGLASQVAKKHAIPWVFDARGLWVDEKVDKGGLRTRGMMYSWLKRKEKMLYAQASAWVLLANTGIEALRRQGLLPGVRPLKVIPTCVDTAAFVPKPQSRAEAGHPQLAKRIVCVGSVGPGYLGREVFRLFALAQKHYPDFQCELCTRSDRQLVHRLARETGVDWQHLRIYSAPADKMPAVLAAGGIGVSFITPTPSKQASCPTKVGEYLACGMPVIYNPGIGDMDEVLGHGSVAVPCHEFSQESLQAALAQAVALFESENARKQCRQLAIDYFSLDKGVAAYDALYQAVLEGRNSAGEVL